MSGTPGEDRPLPSATVNISHASWHAMAAMLWWMFALARLPEHHRGFWLQIPATWKEIPWHELTFPGFLLAPLRPALLVVLALLFACACAGLGGAVRMLLPRLAAESRERRVVDVLLGFALLGGLNLGWGLTGCFTPEILLLAPVAGMFLPGARGLAASVVAGARRVELPRPRGPLVFGYLPAVPALVFMCTPSGHVDAWTYHFLIPEQMLRIHKYVAEGAPYVYGLPLAAELACAPAIAAGLEALPNWLQFLPFLAVALQLGWWAERNGGPGAGWMGGAAMITFGHLQQMMATGKNDLASAAYPAAGALALARALEGNRSWLPASALLFGAGATLKSSGQALAGLAFLGLLGSRARPSWFAWISIAAVPVLPWLLRSAAWWGDPLWPVLSGHLPGALWSKEDAASVYIARGNLSPVAALVQTGPELVRVFVTYQPALALTIPLVLAGIPMLVGAGRWMLGFSIAAMVMLAILMVSEWSRLAMPVFILWAAMTAVALRRLAEAWPAWFRVATLWVAAGLGWVPLGEYLSQWTAPPASIPYLAGVHTRETFFARRMTTLNDVRTRLLRMNPSGRLIAMGDIRYFRLPIRIHSVRNWGSTWAWELSRDCATTERIRVKLRQTDARVVLYNFVTEGYPHPHAEPYAWTDRQIAVWRDYVELWLDLEGPPERVDHLNGGFVLYTVRTAPRPERPTWLPYLPGLESLYYTITSCRDMRSWIENAMAVNRRVPNVDWIRNYVGLYYYHLGDHEQHWHWVSTGLLHGSVADRNFWNAGISALETDRFAEAERAFLLAAGVEPDYRHKALRIAHKVRLEMEARREAKRESR